MPNNDSEYIWTVKDIRELDKRLSVIPEMQQDIKEIKEELAVKNHIVVDNTNKTDWKAVAAIITAVAGTIGTVLVAVWSSK